MQGLQIQAPPIQPQSTRAGKKSCIQIRSFSYKKALNDPKDIEFKKELAKTSFTRLQSPTASDFALTAEKIRPETTKHGVAAYSTQETFFKDNQSSQPKRRFFEDIDTYNTTETNFMSTKSDLSPSKNRQTANYFKPAISVTTHTLSIGQNDKKKTGYMPQIGSKKSISRPRKVGTKPDYIPPPDDYFHLLYDPKRKPFDYQDYEGFYEHYTDDEIRNRIYDMGFRDPNYYNRRAPFPMIQVPEEDKIKEKYAFKMPNNIKQMDNENTLVTHVLGGSRNNIKHVESIIDVTKDKLKLQGKLEQDLKSDIKAVKDKFDKELADMEKEMKAKFALFTETLKNDFVNKQNQDFKIQKDIMLLNRDKQQLEKEITYEQGRLNDIERFMYDRDNMFDVEPADKTLENLSEMNLRPEKAHTMKNNKVIH